MMRKHHQGGIGVILNFIIFDHRLINGNICRKFDLGVLHYSSKKLRSLTEFRFILVFVFHPQLCFLVQGYLMKKLRGCARMGHFFCRVLMSWYQYLPLRTSVGQFVLTPVTLRLPYTQINYFLQTSESMDDHCHCHHPSFRKSSLYLCYPNS